MTTREAMEIAIGRSTFFGNHRGGPDRIRRLLTSDQPPEDLLPGRAIWNLSLEARAALRQLTSDDPVLHPRADVLGFIEEHDWRNLTSSRLR